MTRLQFITFLEEFKQNLDQNSKSWKNINLSDFLEAMQRYTEDLQGYYDNLKIDRDADIPTWENFQTILLGAAIYE